MIKLPQTVLKARPWLRSAPLQEQVGQFVETNQLTPVKILGGGAYSLVWLCKDDLVLKVLPTSKEAFREAYTLRTWPVAETRPIKLQDNILLLRYHHGGTIIDDVWEESMHHLMAKLCARLHQKRYSHPNPSLPTLQEIKDQRYQELSRRLDQTQAASKLAYQQLDRIRMKTSKPQPDHPALLHGDFTPGNIVHHNGELIPIDPKGCWGDPHSDWASWVMAGIPAGWQERANIFQAALEKEGVAVEPKRLATWCEYLIFDGWVSSLYRHDGCTQDWRDALDPFIS